MRRSSFMPRVRADGGGSAAPFAVVAVVILLGAGIAYVQLQSYEVSRQAAWDREPYGDGAEEVLQRELARVHQALEAAVGQALTPDGPVPSDTVVSWVAARVELAMADWARTSYPHDDGPYTVTLEVPRLTVLPVHARVEAGNPLGQRTVQVLPVGVHAVASCSLEIAEQGGLALTRDVTATAARPAPQVLAAHQQNVLEYSLAEDGLVGVMLADALRANLASSSGWVASPGEVSNTLMDAVRAVEWSLMGSPDPSMPVGDLRLPGDGSLEVRGGGLTVYPDAGRAAVELPHSPEISFTFAPTGRTHTFRLVPRTTIIAGPVLELSQQDYAAAEAEGHSDATAVRVTYGVRLDHVVECELDGAAAAPVARTIESRASVTAWKWGRSIDADIYKSPQVEDWDAFGSAMSVAGSAVADVTLEVEGHGGVPVSVALDGVYLGEQSANTVRLRNVQVGVHELSVWTQQGARAAMCATEVRVGEGGSPLAVALDPDAVDADEFMLWFELMASAHRPDAGRIPYLERIAAMVGYPAPPREVALDPEANLDRLVFWEEGLDRYIEALGDAWTPASGPVSGDLLGALKDIHSIYKLTHKLLYSLPKDALRTGRIIVELHDGPRAGEMRAWLRTGEGDVPLLEAKPRPEGYWVRFGKENPRVLTTFKAATSLLGVFSSALGVYKGTVDFVSAVEGGDIEQIAVMGFDLYLDLAGLVMSVINFLKAMKLVAFDAFLKGAFTVIGAAMTVVSTFFSAYKEAGNDVVGAFRLLFNPATFSAAMRSAGFASGIATLVAVAVMVKSGAALASAALVATGVGAIVFLAVIAIWAIVHWREVRAWFAGWISGTAKEKEVSAADEGITAMLESTMRLRAQLNAVDVEADLLRSRLDRGAALALMGARSTMGDAGLVAALGGSALKGLDDASAQARRAKAVAEAGYWVEALWREADDFIDSASLNGSGRPSEGFEFDKDAWLSKTHHFWTEIWIVHPNGVVQRVRQQDGTLAGLLRAVNTTNVEGVTIDFSIKGLVYGPALRDYNDALTAIAGEVGRCVEAIGAASREAAYIALQGSASEYNRVLSVIEVVTSEGLDHSGIRLDVSGPPTWSEDIAFGDGTATLLVPPGGVVSTLKQYHGDIGEHRTVVAGVAHSWWHPGFGRDVLDHRADARD